jgi:predicted TIM-barrel fold metal-dependent hydrolase
MGKLHTIKIDAYAHMAPVKYLKALQKLLPKELAHRIPQHAPLYDLDYRFRIMDKYEVMQVLAPTEPALEEVVDPQKAEDLAKLANDEMAELVSKYPDRFLAAIAYLPMNNMDATLKEVDRAINDLRFRGVLYTVMSMGSHWIHQNLCHFMRRWPNTSCQYTSIHREGTTFQTIRQSPNQNTTYIVFLAGHMILL